jgi:uncharacterized membrane protein
MLVLLTGPYAISRLVKAFTGRDFDRDAGVIGLTLLFILTGVGHFIDTESMSQMLPSWVPARIGIIYLTGVLEFMIAGGFLFRRFRRMTGWVTVAILILFFPANVYAAIYHVPQGGHAWGPVYLFIRAPLQLIILAWIYWFTLKRAEPERKPTRR